jgi:hypothetical protein
MAPKRLNLRLSKNQWRLPDEEPDVKKIGIELEYWFSPSTIQLAQLHHLTGEEQISRFEEILINEIHKLSPLTTEVKPDQGHSEFITRPSSLRAFQSLHNHVEKLFNLLHASGFGVNQTWNPSGLHISIDRVDDVNTFLKALDFMFYNDLFFLALSGRKHYATRKADLTFLLGNKTRSWSTDKTMLEYKRLRSLLKHAYQTVTSAEILGIRVYKDRNYIHFGHFASTLDVQHLFSCIEFVYSLFEYAEISENNEIEKYLEWLSENKEIYPSLYARVDTITRQVSLYNKQLGTVLKPLLKDVYL